MTIETARGRFTRQADEALGSRLVPLDDASLRAKFTSLVAPVLDADAADTLAGRLWSIEEISDIAALIETTAR